VVALSRRDRQALVEVIEQRERADPKFVHLFVEPRYGLLANTKAPKSHAIFGRRGSGKTSLLLKAVHDLSEQDHPVSMVDVEPYRLLDRWMIIANILLDALEGYSLWLGTGHASATSRRMPKSLFERFLIPWRGKDTNQVERLRDTIGDLVSELRIRTDRASAEDQAPSTNKHGIIGALLTGRRAPDDKYTSGLIPKLRELFHILGTIFGKPAYLFIDDFYRLPIRDQPFVAGYLHSLVKPGAGRASAIFLKIGTVRNRTTFMVNEDGNRVGLNISGDDVAAIDLDASLEHFAETQSYLNKILGQLCAEAGLALNTLLGAVAVDRLVRGSGGVTRDFLLLLKDCVPSFVCPTAPRSELKMCTPPLTDSAKHGCKNSRANSMRLTESVFC
jgi:hypothetical protein